NPGKKIFFFLFKKKKVLGGGGGVFPKKKKTPPCPPLLFFLPGGIPQKFPSGPQKTGVPKNFLRKGLFLKKIFKFLENRARFLFFL
ncbi:hypothetical protein, partial [Actinobacillus pleuropneumoniae]|uniref:hypothetical protein n=1 Tax=Actinobacillus pleuropneumoniae TaxID=715 RepID=UPI0005B20A82